MGWSSIEGLPVSWVACRLDTGRTHQIRVHLTSEDLPLIGDQVYRGRAPGLTVKVENELDFHRQALHASRLGLDHPVTGEYMEWFVPPEDDMIDLMDELGFLENDARVFQSTVLRALDSETPVLAAVKPKDTPFLRAVRGHENAELVFIDEQNRDALLEKLLPHILRWNEA